MWVSRIAWAAVLAATPTLARAPRLGGELRVPLTAPVIEATLNGVSVRLTVDLAARNTIELNPEAAARLPLRFEPGAVDEVGRERLSSRIARARLILSGERADVQVSTHERPCCAGVDGAISPALLPFQLIRFAGSGPGPVAPSRSFTMLYSREGGLELPVSTPSGTVRLQFSLSRNGTIATRAAGSILAAGYGGMFDGPYGHIPGAFGIERPARPMRFARPVALAGFPIGAVQVLTADYGAGRPLPIGTARPGDILVAGASTAQDDWPSLLLGREHFAACNEILYWTVSRTIRFLCP